MADDDDLWQGIHNLEEILSRLDDRASNLKWLKEHAPQHAPAKLKQDIVDSFPPPKDVPPAAAPVEPPAPEPAPAPVPELDKIAEDFFDGKPEFLKEPQSKPAEPPVKVQEQPVKAQEPPLKAQEPAKVQEPPVKAKEPPAKVKEPPAKVREPQAQPAEQKPAVKPAGKPFALNTNKVIFFLTGLAIAVGGYQLTLNSAAHRYAQAGRLVEKARNAEAISAYSKIITQYPRAIEAAYSEYAIGDIKAVQGDAPAAIEHYEHYLVAAPPGDARIASARFKIAELEYKNDDFPNAEFLYQNAAIQASDLAAQAAARVSQIRAVKAQLADAAKLIPKSPDKAVEAYTAVLAAHPRLAAAQAGLEAARKALEEAKARPAARRKAAPKPAPRELTKSVFKAALGGTAPAPAGKPAARQPASVKAQFDACNAVWMTEKMQGQLDADMIFSKVNNNCDALKQKLTACKDAQEEVKAMEGVTPAARTLMEQEVNPDWTLARQLEEDKKVQKRYDDLHCADLLKAVPN